MVTWVAVGGGSVLGVRPREQGYPSRISDTDLSFQVAAKVWWLLVRSAICLCFLWSFHLLYNLYTHPYISFLNASFLSHPHDFISPFPSLCGHYMSLKPT